MGGLKDEGHAKSFVWAEALLPLLLLHTSMRAHLSRVCMWEPEVNLSLILQKSSTFPFEIWFSISLELTDLASRPLSPRDLLFFPSTGIANIHHHVQLFYVEKVLNFIRESLCTWTPFSSDTHLGAYIYTYIHIYVCIYMCVYMCVCV